MARVVMRHRSFFTRRRFYWSHRDLNENREEIRDEAEAFINRIGAENVVSVVEHSMTGATFCVVVWYRVEESAAEPSQLLTGERASAPSGVRIPPRGPGA
jgi:hypothetical protein